MKIWRTLTAALFLVGFGTSSVQAFTIDIYHPADSTLKLATLSGTGAQGSVLGFVAIGATEPGKANVFDVVNSGDATETAFMNSLNQNNPTVAFAGKLGDNSFFQITEQYFSVKFGNFGNEKGGTAFFKFLNAPSDSVTLEFTKLAGSGLSHVTQYNAVPLPAAVWLFGSALLGMVGIGYRRKTQSA